MGWQRRQYTKGGTNFRKVHKGERDWTRAEKDAIRQFEEQQHGNNGRSDANPDQRKAG